MWRALLIAHCQPSLSDQGVNAGLVDMSLQCLVTLNLARDTTITNDVIAVYIKGKLGSYITVSHTNKTAVVEYVIVVKD